MQFKTKILPIITLVFIIFACGKTKQEVLPVQETFDIETMKPVIKKLSQQWGDGLKKKDTTIFENLYDEEALYLPNDDVAFQGRKAIVEYWRASFDFLLDIQLDMKTLSGTKEVLYETGTGIATAPNEIGKIDTFYYKYVNVWKLQPDGSYKVVIDTYNNRKH